MELRVIGAEDLRKSLPMADAIEAMKDAYRQLSGGKTSMPLRSRIETPDGEGIVLFMPALLHDSAELALKVVSVFTSNPELGLPTIHALVVALDANTGVPMALLEGGTLTAIRTGAGSGAATDLLARTDARTVAIFGSGIQARTQLEAVCTVRTIEQVWIYSLDIEGAHAYVDQLAGSGPIPGEVQIVDTPNEAVAEADIICTATTSITPVFDDQAVRPGTHINAIGSYTPEMQEVPTASVVRALLVVDSREAVLAESGDVIIPLQTGAITEEHLHAELGEIVSGSRPGRTSAEQITLFKSVGVAVQDAMAAGRALAMAQELDLGQLIEL